MSELPGPAVTATVRPGAAGRLVVERTPRRVLALCWLVLVLEGYDVVALGAVAPALLRLPGWGITRGDIGLLGSVAVVGLLLGALLAGPLVDRRGRRPVLVASVALFGVGMAVCAVAPAPLVFGGGRLLVGLGAGALLPTATAMVAEYASPRRRYFAQGVAFGGIGVGGALSGTAALVLDAGTGFRAVFVLGALASVVVVAVLLRTLPESAEHLLARGRDDEARALLARHRVAARIVPAQARTATDAAGSWRYLLAPESRSTTLLFWATTALSLLVLFGANTWLPVMMITAGYDLGSALGLLVVLNLGFVLGTLGSSRLADLLGPRRVIFGAFAAAAAAFVLLAQSPPLPVAYLLVAVVGTGAIGTQLLVNAAIAASYPSAHRATALGSALGVGRVGGVVGPLYGGWLLAGGSAATGFYGFAVPALLAGVVATLVPRVRRPPAPRPAGGTAP